MLFKLKAVSKKSELSYSLFSNMNNPQLTILMFGDIVGKIGRKALIQKLPDLKKRYKPDLTIANVENLAHGRGITEKTLNEIKSAGVDVFTSGHHVWENKPGANLLNNPDWNSILIRPANVDPKLEGKGWCKLKLKDQDIYILNLQGELFMSQDASSPFLSFDGFYKEHIANPSKSIILVDFHAEATSEKVALANYADGRAALVYGTHTHVPTADSKILPNGTGYCTDIGMTGALDSVIGFEKNSSIKRFLNLSEAPYELTESGSVEVNFLVVAIDLDQKKTVKIQHERKIVDVLAK